ncbi:hypothetical protein Y032_0161g3364 [Ancylostoma ceylanicum]|uniref:Uncharacterized protein n=1 Tax=Ancylostoma ceylanicum TaxID=53326 RepID=A0A016SX47_9BILA|nr:hypothetical protein Y032_0161g3364 [Ancylostoma ceylanicum]
MTRVWSVFQRLYKEGQITRFRSNHGIQNKTSLSISFKLRVKRSRSEHSENVAPKHSSRQLTALFLKHRGDSFG